MEAEVKVEVGDRLRQDERENLEAEIDFLMSEKDKISEEFARVEEEKELLLKGVKDLKLEKEGLDEMLEQKEGKIAELNINLTKMQLELLQER